MFSKGDTVQYIGYPGSNTINGWTFFAPMTHGLQFQYLPSHLKLISKARTKKPSGDIITEQFNKRTNKFERVLWGVRIRSYIGRSLLVVSPFRFYSRKHAQEWAREFKSLFGMGLIRFETYIRPPQ